ncbi:unnamed protein product [Psylliodes chrysocephalus]|uniref:Uncharacterized protein n=1 Tax=Psylliodes chrysocephalus TaxID=3402493 RepID=A0A9P0DAF5_9CUCU|nr:unnamed protein product [Psylliodes chrysocephala]
MFEIMQQLIFMNENITHIKGDIKGDINDIKGDINNIKGDINDMRENLERKIDEITQVREEVKERNKKLRAEIDKEGVNIRLEIGKDVKEKVTELKGNIEKKLLGEIQIDVTKQTDMLNREIGHMKLQGQVHEKAILNCKEIVDKEIEKLNGIVEEQSISCTKRSEIGETNFRRGIEEMNRKMQNRTEDI